jgi:hypothetical protein
MVLSQSLVELVARFAKQMEQRTAANATMDTT